MFQIKSLNKLNRNIKKANAGPELSKLDFDKMMEMIRKEKKEEVKKEEETKKDDNKK